MAKNHNPEIFRVVVLPEYRVSQAWSFLSRSFSFASANFIRSTYDKKGHATKKIGLTALAVLAFGEAAASAKTLTHSGILIMGAPPAQHGPAPAAAK